MKLCLEENGEFLTTPPSKLLEEVILNSTPLLTEFVQSDLVTRPDISFGSNNDNGIEKEEPAFLRNELPENTLAPAPAREETLLFPLSDFSPSVETLDVLGTDNQLLSKSGTEIFINSLKTSRGVAIDSQNNVLVYDFDLNDSFELVDIVKKFDQEGVLVDEIELSIFSDSIKFAELPNSNSFVGLTKDGTLTLIEPEPLAVNFLDHLHISSLEGVETSPVYHITWEDLISDPMVLLSDSIYNDIAIRQNGNSVDLFITGAYLSGMHPFVMRVETSSDLTNFIEAQVLMVGARGFPEDPNEPPLPRDPSALIGPGIAVNADGTVLTALPTFEGGDGYAYPDLVAFPANFNPTDVSDSDPSNDPMILPNGLGIDSFGMTADDGGNFYILTDSVLESRVMIFPPTLEQPSRVESLGTLPTGFWAWGDIAVDPMNEKAYVTFRDNSDYASVVRIDAVSQPDLTPYQPSGWDDKIVLSTVAGTHTDASQITANDDIYVDWAFINQGDSATSNVIPIRLLLDGNEIKTWTRSSSLEPNYYTWIEDYVISIESAGTYTLTLEVDYSNQVNESNESNNEYSRTFTVENDNSPGSISGMKWNDLNSDGIKDSGELGLANWEIYIDENQNGQLDTGEPTQTTDAQGNYTFPNLGAGTYIIAEVQQAGWEQTYPNLGMDTIPQSPDEVLESITTTASKVPIYKQGETVPPGNEGSITPQTDISGPLINIDDFRADPRFAGINGNGFAAVILDGGIDLDHPFFGSDSNGDGISDRIVYQYDFADGDGDASDVDGHGSNVSSIVASSDSTYKGMAPGADIIHLKVFEDSGDGNFSYIEQALQWVVNNAATYNIASVNMSLGDGDNYTTSQTLYGINDELAALNAMDIIVASASGNGFYTHGSAQGVAYPSADPNSLSVGAVYDEDVGPVSWQSGARDLSSDADRIASFSQRHGTLSDIFAPGPFSTGAGANGGLETQGGTSQASPHIAGIAILAQQLATQRLGRRLSASEFSDLLDLTAVIINDGDNEDDNVSNTDLDFNRVDVMSLGESIWEMGTDLPGTHTVNLGLGEDKSGINFGNRQLDNNRPNIQTITTRPDPTEAASNQLVNLTVNYDTADNEENLTGFGLRLHFDSSQLKFVRLDVLELHLVSEAVQEDSQDYDNDPTTDRFLATGWLDPDGQWPGSVPIALYNAQFNTAAQFSGTTINYTAASTAVGYDFSGDSVTVGAASEADFSWDVDGNGDADFLSDGLLIQRYLFGDFEGDALIDNALAPDATRTSAEAILDYLNPSRSLLDIDANGASLPLTDGILINRYLLGVSGEDLIEDALAPDATRISPDAITDYLDAYLPDSLTV